MKSIAQYLFLIIFLTSCNVLNFSEGELTTDLKLEADEISNIQDIEATFTVRNKTKEPITFEFSTGCQLGFKVLDRGISIFNSEENQLCTEALTSFTLKRDESKSLQIPHHFGDTKLESGDYSIKTFLIGFENEVSASKEFVVN